MSPEVKTYAWAYAEERFGVTIVRVSVAKVGGAHELVLRSDMDRLLAEAQAELALAKVDTARYQWLRDEAPGEISFDHIRDEDHCFELRVPFDGREISSDEESARTLDAAIDAAIAASKP